MALQKVLKETEDKMRRTVEAVAREFSTVRTGRANTGLVEGIMVDYFGTPTPLKHLAQINTPEPRLIVIQPWDANATQEIERAIMKSDIGLTPTVDGKVLRITVPSLTSERRAELDKLVRKMAEDGRISLRTARRDANEHIKQLQKDGTITEDDGHRAQEKVQKLTDQFTHQVDDMMKRKEHELKDV